MCLGYLFPVYTGPDFSLKSQHLFPIHQQKTGVREDITYVNFSRLKIWVQGAKQILLSMPVDCLYVVQSRIPSFVIRGLVPLGVASAVCDVLCISDSRSLLVLAVPGRLAALMFSVTGFGGEKKTTPHTQQIVVQMADKQRVSWCHLWDCARHTPAVLPTGREGLCIATRLSWTWGGTPL